MYKIIFLLLENCNHTPSLFEKDVFPRTGRDISPQLARLNRIKKEVLSCENIIQCIADDDHDIAILLRNDLKVQKLGIFSLKGNAASVTVPFPDGTYTNHLDGTVVTVAEGMLHCCGNPIVLTCKQA